ncbi:hypothetical protein ACP70R_002111 [Stipagrostis hirtigluma subsp. patula]
MAGEGVPPLEERRLEGLAGAEDQAPADKMAEMIGRLNLTAEESDALLVVDDEEDGLATSDCAVIGKVLSQNVLHMQTIMSALRPAWGNPKGLVAKSVGDNLFVAEFGSMQEKEKVMDGTPWMVGRKAVLIQDFDAGMRPTDITFHDMAIWVRIYNLPLGWMNKRWGEEIAAKIGSLQKVELDEQDRAWGPYLRAKVKIDITKPLRRGVSLFSARRQKTEWYEVRYEKLPNYCYSCGIIGHSSIECSTPGERDANGVLPYGVDLRATDDKKKKGSDDTQGQSSSSAGRSSNFASHRDPSFGNNGGNLSDFKGQNENEWSQRKKNSNIEDGTEATSPMKARTKKGHGQPTKNGNKEKDKSKKKLFPTQTPSSSNQGRKRKQLKGSDQESDKLRLVALGDDEAKGETISQAEYQLVPLNSGSDSVVNEVELDDTIHDLSKKPKKEQDVLVNQQDGIVWRSTFVYGEPRKDHRHKFWDLIRFIRAQWDGPWICAGDFNEALSSDEHLGKTERGEAQMKLFRDCLEDCELVDLGFTGPKFTWNNKQIGNDNVKVRLDRAVANGKFLQIFDDCYVENVAAFSSDHYAILISVKREEATNRNRSAGQIFRYEAMWARAEDYKDVVEQSWIEGLDSPKNLTSIWSNINKMASILRQWSKKTFEIMAKQRSRIDWLKEGLKG